MGRSADDVAAAVRTFGLVGHRSAGKTQLAESLLHAAGVVREPGLVDRGEALLASEPEEHARGGSLWPAIAWMPWQDTVVQLVDTPGDDASIHTARLALSGVDAELLVISGPDGLERGAEDALRASRHADRPMIAVISKLDRPSDVDGILARLAEVGRRRVLPLQIPVFDGHGALSGLVDVIEERLLTWSAPGEPTVGPIPDEHAAEAEALRERLVDAAAMCDEALLEACLAHAPIAAASLWPALARAVQDGVVLPVLFASGVRGVGAQPLLDSMSRLTPCPLSWTLPPDGDGQPAFVAQWIASRLDAEGQVVSIVRVWQGHVGPNLMWKNARTGATVRVRKPYEARGPRRSVARHDGPGTLLALWEDLPGLPGDTFTDGPRVPLGPPASRPPMAWLNVAPRDPNHRERVVAGLGRLSRLDPSVRVEDDPSTGAIRLSGTNPRQLEQVVELLRGRLALEVTAALPPVRYLERPAAGVTGVHTLHRKEKGGTVSEFAEVWVDMAPAPIDAPFRYVSDVDEDVLPTRFQPPVGEGAKRALEQGPTGGYPVRGVFVRLTGGEYDVLESKEEHFVTAGELVMRSALHAAGTELWEPWTEVHVFVPSADVGAVLSDLAAQRARVMGLEVDHDDETSIQAWLPDRDLRTLSTRLDSLTGGRGWFIPRSTHYDKLPRELVADAVASSPFRRVRSTDAK
jgi:elongation factor G